MSWIDWNALSKDAEGKPLTSTDEAVQNLKETAAEYGTPNVLLILNHDAEDKKVTARSVPAMVKYLSRAGDTSWASLPDQTSTHEGPC